ncbi:solute carrier family 22 member 5-like [Mytilus californianus]|uniref:solute carrier family 22 member 5-like n=1 Tax=Mytilus californianus TaxID=6549 RepID=UPI002245809E|nr:solute carrier family 22 member 5-like [Mytilus californianus]
MIDAYIFLSHSRIIDESLRWLIANKRADEAKTLVRKIAKFNKIDLNDILPLLQHDGKIVPFPIHQNPKEEKRENILTIARHKILLKTSFIMAFTWMTNAMTYFGLTLNSAQLAGNRFLNLFLYQVVEIFAMLTFLLIINRLKRRHVSMLFHGIAGVSLVISALLGSFKNYSDKFTTASVALSFLGKFGISASFSTIFLYTPELYPTNLRNIGIGIASSAGRIGGLLAPFSTLLTEYLEWGPGVVFGVCCISVTVLQHFLPESSGKEMPQTVQELKAWKRDKTTIIR